jgi:hypothetical protein
MTSLSSAANVEAVAWWIESTISQIPTV